MNMKSRSGIAIIVLALTCLLLGSALAVMYFQHVTTMTGHIKVVGDFEVYLDEACTELATSYDWGEFSVTEVSEEKNMVLWFKSKSNIALEISYLLTDEDATWECGTGYVTPAPFDPLTAEWLLESMVNEGTLFWIGEDSTVTTGDITKTITLTAYDDVASAEFSLMAYQSLAIYEPLDFTLTFSSHDTY